MRLLMECEATKKNIFDVSVPISKLGRSTQKLGRIIMVDRMAKCPVLACVNIWHPKTALEVP
jgi:hypothetical protein